MGKLRPNAWGLHGMHGNVFEWCQDAFRLYSGDAATDPSHPGKGPWAIRGGSSQNGYWNCRSAYRDAHGRRFAHLGFRVARSAE